MFGLIFLSITCCFWHIAKFFKKHDNDNEKLKNLLILKQVEKRGESPGGKMGDEKSTNSQSGGSGKNIGMAILCYLGILVLIPLLTEAKNDPFVKFHIKQGLALLIAWVITWVVGVIPVIGGLIGIIVSIVLFVLFIIGIINAASGKETELPIIGKFGESFKI